MPHPSLHLGTLSLDLGTGRVEGGASLAGKELALLRYFAARAGAVVSRDELLREVWGYHPHVITRVVDLTISRLRRRIEPDPVNPAYLKTVHGEGYVLVVAPEVPRAADPTRPEEGPFVGRARELAFLAEWAAGQGRWLTVVGPPGIGKSRLARESLHRVGAGAADGALPRVAFARLDGARSAVDVASRLGRALGLRLDTLGDPVAWLVRAVGDRPVLLFLDDIDLAREVLLGLQRTSSAAPGLRVIATARRALGFPGEPLLRLGPLSPDEAGTLLERLSGRTHAETAPTAGNPLAISLLAAAIRGGAAGGGFRGLDDAIGASWERLPPPHRRELARFSIFAGAFDDDMALGALGASTDGLDRLVDESLIEASDAHYSLHPAIRDFARRQLESSGEAEVWREHHMTWHLDGLAASLPALRGAHRREARRIWLARLDDLEISWMRAVEAGDAALVGRALEAVEDLLAQAGQWLLGHRCFDAALRMQPIHEDATLRLALLAADGRSMGRLGAGARAWARLAEALEAPALPPTGRVRLLRAQVDAGISVVSDAEVLAAAIELQTLCSALLDPRERLLGLLCALQFRAGANLQAPEVSETEETVALAVALGERGLLGTALYVRGLAACRAGESAAAQRDLERATGLLDEEVDGGPFAQALSVDGLTRIDLGQVDEGLALLARAELAFERQGAVPRLWSTRRNRATTLVTLGRLDEAEALLDATLAAARGGGLSRLEMSTLETLVEHRVASQRWDEAVALGAEARAVAERHGMMGSTTLDGLLALSHLCRGAPDLALAHAEAGLALLARSGERVVGQVETLRLLRELGHALPGEEAPLWAALRAVAESTQRTWARALRPSMRVIPSRPDPTDPEAP